ncbi:MULTISPECIES: UDP-N-acetylglucosamine 2-epimerase [unclassified Sphingomonas]|uniref:UDP-N-acetylglucosamine 2-epimerase n=1 Tax=unclassified Sphingomonas TaxID=196159 RepID=UPI0006FE543E|nr:MULTISPECIES: UDP-N-acetylglucosamine 2-epimerase [unclassified Sphingomonas]KQX19538.1 UDP-N-acetyl glucosamine 2-epimerase [Sphingomonas sp. Root1294]KQY65739.1 UDP-N-acetyl glucosamine 2-epimerase [Sphingomonas sp. Root50]KRB94956.1 UDP-N-acetyl glucosamine 2-epimerase [Sphingomonas sp. Root720]
MSKKIIFVTGTRADFGKLEPLAIAARENGFGVTFFVTGMHMMEQYGLTKTEVHRSGLFDVVEYINQRQGDPQDIILAKTVIGFSDFLKEAKPDLVIIHGDRVEALACALVCAMNYVLCAHVEGGEVSGTIDEMFRHCNTKLSAVHLVSSEQAKQRVIRLGEDAGSVEVIGSPEIDIHAQPSGVAITEVIERYEIASIDYGICIFHPVTSEVATLGAQAASLFSSLAETNRYFVVILPNNDPGSEDILQEIRRLPAARFRVLPSLRFHYFSELLKNAKVMIGNSSLGVREAPFLGVPSLDLGTRQTNRATAPSIFKASALDRDAIGSFVDDNWGKRFESHLAFGAGQSREKFLKLLLDEGFWSRPLQKYFHEDPLDDDATVGLS